MTVEETTIAASVCQQINLSSNRQNLTQPFPLGKRSLYQDNLVSQDTKMLMQNTVCASPKMTALILSHNLVLFALNKHFLTKYMCPRGFINNLLYVTCNSEDHHIC